MLHAEINTKKVLSFTRFRSFFLPFLIIHFCEKKKKIHMRDDKKNDRILFIRKYKKQ